MWHYIRFLFNTSHQKSFQDWGGLSTFSVLAQVFKKLAHYPNNWAEARKDIKYCKEASRITIGPWMHVLFNGLGSDVLRSECIADVFKRVAEGQGHTEYLFADQSSLGTWSTSGTQVNSARV